MTGRSRTDQGILARAGPLLAGLVLLLAACGGTASRPSLSPPADTPAPEGLFVVLQASTGHLWWQDPNTLQVGTRLPDAIAIVGRDGRVYARTTFQAQARPWILPDLAPVLPPVAHVAAGRAYYIDGSGAVRSLGWKGDVREETRFPVTSSQQEASFAVSPDGKTLVGSVVTFPSRPNPEPAAPYRPTDPYSMYVMVARAGMPATVTYHEEWRFDDRQSSGAQFVGWNPQGPVAAYPAILGTQGGPPHQYNGPLVQFPGGMPGQPVPTPDGASVQDMLPSGSYVSLVGDMTGTTLLVSGPDGGSLWSYRSQIDPPFHPFLAPDVQHLVAQAAAGGQVIGRDGGVASLPGGYMHGGWLDAATVIGYPNGSSPRLAYVVLGDIAKEIDTGIEGVLEGSVS